MTKYNENRWRQVDVVVSGGGYLNVAQRKIELDFHLSPLGKTLNVKDATFSDGWQEDEALG